MRIASNGQTTAQVPRPTQPKGQTLSPPAISVAALQFGIPAYKNFFVVERENEEKAARELWRYIDSLSEDDVIYHYGSYEKTKANRLKEKYGLPEATLEKFDRLRVDLYRVVEQCSDWPLSSYGVKSIAKHLGFKWTSEDASGANSIAWFQEYQSNPANKELFEKILTYNREDCEAMIVVKDYLVKNSQPMTDG